MYVPLRTAAEHFNVSKQTIATWADRGEIDFIVLPRGHRRFKLRGEGNTSSGTTSNGDKKEKVNVCYCRVSSNGQKDDLQRQINYMQEKYPGWTIYADIGSGLNWKRKGLKTILRRCMQGDLGKVAVAHKDRLARFGFELIEYVMAQCGVELLCEGESAHKSRETELVDDILSIVTVFSARIHGGRHYNKGTKNCSAPNEGSGPKIDQVDGLLPVDVQPGARIHKRRQGAQENLLLAPQQVRQRLKRQAVE